MPQERAEKRIDELVHIGTVSDTAKVPMEDNGEAYYAEIGQFGIPRSADLDEDEGIVSFKDSAGITLFTLDLAGFGGNIIFGNLVVSTNSIALDEEETTTFTVSLASAPSQNQPVYIAVSDNAKVSVSPEVLTFTPENWSVAQTVTVSALPDADYGDESETITITSRKVSAKQIAVAITDTTEPPVELVTDGLDLYFNFRNGNEGLTDTINGVVATATNGTFDNNGLSFARNNGNLAWTYPVTTNIPNGFTIEIGFSSSYTYIAGVQPVPYLAASGSGYTTNGYAYQNSWGNSALRSGFAYNVDGTKTANDISIPGTLKTDENWANEHTLSYVYESDGSAYLAYDGVKVGNGRAAPDGFENYVVSGNMSFKTPYLAVSNTYTDTYAFIRFYNRALTAAELLNNHKFDVQQQTTANFT